MLQNMSTTIGNDNNVSMCANCGKSEEESHKLKHCNACKLVKYCNRDCQIAHRSQHRRECRRRAAELHDENLLQQPKLDEDDCPICFQQLPLLNPSGKKYKSCCGKFICSGCMYAPVYDNQGNKVDNQKCPFCRTPPATSEEEIAIRIKKRVDAGDVNAMHGMGCFCRDGDHSFPQDYKKALELFHRAAELGYAESYCSIGWHYSNGKGVEVDKEKANHYYELAAIAGNVQGRHNLGLFEARAGDYGRAVKHFMIAVRGGDNDSLRLIQTMYSNGHATKEDYLSLQMYQTYLGKIKSRQRDEAAAYDEAEYRYY